MRPRAAAPPPAPHPSPATHAAARRASPADAPELTRNSILRISDAKTIQLIQEWEKQECLWNTNLKDYPNKEERLIATAVIADKLDIPNFTPEHVSMKFKNLRNSYCQELKKMASDENYKPRVFWFSYMDKFIKPHLQKINSYNIDTSKFTHLDKSTYNTIKIELDTDDDHDDWAVEHPGPGEASGSNSIRIESTYSEHTASENGENSNQSHSRKRKHSRDSVIRSDLLRRRSENGEQSDPLNVNGENRIKIVQAKVPRKDVITTSEKENRKVDYCDTFGTYIASLLRTLPRRKALMLQPKIVELIVSVGIEQMMNDDDSDS